MKLTTKKLKQMIKEELNMLQGEAVDHGEMAQRYYPEERDELRVTPADVGWTVTGTYKGRKVEFDSSKKKYKPSMREWDDSPRFKMARELLGHFGGPGSEEGESFNIGKSDIDNTDIYINGEKV
tara:strand:+ start:126 stop:497 length:372 start_codon:yes stop_codon:yes gene_type:complete